MKLLMIICATLAVGAFALPTDAYSYPRSLEIALEDEVTDHLEDDYGFIYDDAEYDCERIRFRRYECEGFIEATASRDVTITDSYGDEVTVMEEDEVECYIDALATKRAAWSRYGRYRISLDNLECDIVTP